MHDQQKQHILKRTFIIYFCQPIKSIQCHVWSKNKFLNKLINKFRSHIELFHTFNDLITYKYIITKH